MNEIVHPQIAVRYVEAMGKQNLLDVLESNVLEVSHAE